MNKLFAYRFDLSHVSTKDTFSYEGSKIVFVAPWLKLHLVFFIILIQAGVHQVRENIL